MLSRIAESLYWIGRYLERAEGTARLLDVYYHQLLEERGINQTDACRLLLEIMGYDAGAVGIPLTPAGVTHALAYDESSPVSIRYSIDNAWENARGAREAISNELWQTLNTLHQGAELEAEAGTAMPHGFFAWMLDRSAAFAGLAESTMTHDDGWRFLVIGRSLERVDMTTRVLRAAGSSVLGRGSWTTLLRCCTAHTAYLRRYRRRVEPQLAVEFLLLDRLFPRSVLHTLNVAYSALADLDPRAERIGATDEPRRRLGRIISEIEYTHRDELYAGLDRMGERIQRSCADVHDAISVRYFLQSAAVEWSS